MQYRKISVTVLSLRSKRLKNVFYKLKAVLRWFGKALTDLFNGFLPLASLIPHELKTVYDRAVDVLNRRNAELKYHILASPFLNENEKQTCIHCSTKAQWYQEYIILAC